MASTGGATPPTTPSGNTTDTQISPFQAGNATDPAVATAPDGHYVVVWTSIVNGASDIVGQLFGTTGIPTSAPFIVNTFAAGGENRPDVAMDNNGDFVVVWSGAGPGYDNLVNTSDVWFRVYNPSGTAVTAAQMLANDYVTSVQDQARVAMDPINGEFVVAWTSFGQPTTPNGTQQNNSNIFYREFLLNGTPMVGATAAIEQQVNASSIYRAAVPDVAMDDAGDFVIVWDQGTGQHLQCPGPRLLRQRGRQRLRAQYDPGRPELHRLQRRLRQRRPLGPVVNRARVSMDEVTGAFAATWANYQSTTNNGYNVYERLFNLNGTSLNNTGESQVNLSAPPAPPVSPSPAGS